MLRYVKDGALDFLASTLPQSLIESIRQVSEDDFLAQQVSHKQRQPRRRRRPVVDSRNSAKAVVATQRNHNGLITNRHANAQELSSETWYRQDIPGYSSSTPTIQLPYEILTLVFQYLPASDLFSVLAVCRFWRQIALVETKHIDISEGFPMDCLGLGNEEYSDFDFVYNLFSIFPLVSSLVIKDRYLRDRDLRVVTAGILAGKMAFTTAGPSVESTSFLAAQKAVAAQRQHREMQLQMQMQQQQESLEKCTAADRDVRSRDNTSVDNNTIAASNFAAESNRSSTTTTSRPSVRMMKGTIEEDLRTFSDSVATYVLIPQTRNTLRKKILAQFELNLEQKEVHDTCWMLENGIDPSAKTASITAWPQAVPSVAATTTTITATANNSTTETAVPIMATDKAAYPLVPMTHYRFQDCCFANDWGANMDRNKLPMIGLAAAISGQGLYVDLEGSYGAPSRSIKTMIGFCFGQNCVISLDLNFRHTHMELEHVTELLSENPILFKMDIVDAPAYQDLIRLAPLRGLGSVLERMHELSLDLDEQGLEASIQTARIILQELERDFLAEVAEMKEVSPKGRFTGRPPAQSTPTGEHAGFAVRGPVHDPKTPIASLAQFLSFPFGVRQADKLRTARILLKGAIDHGIKGLINTRDRHSGQSLLHSLAWCRSYASYVTAIKNASHRFPTPPIETQDMTLVFASSYPPPSKKKIHGGKNNGGDSIATAAHSGHATVTTRGFDTSLVLEPYPSSSLSSSSPYSAATVAAVSSTPSATTTDDSPTEGAKVQPSALSSLLSALAFRRLNLQPVTSLFSNSEPTADYDDPEELSSSAPTASEATAVSAEIATRKLAAAAKMTKPQDELETVGACPLEEEEYDPPAFMIPEQHPVSISLRMAKTLLDLGANPNIYNKDGRSAVLCASFMGFQPMERLLVRHGGYMKELIRIRETM
ncbi:hypothetical protein BG004_001391 [Podila humilis]|nr:hypothetical protein BG004_001391 [Podila humilis]